MTAAEALILYKGRDISEKLFNADKSFIGSKSMRVHSAEALSAKLFVEFVALIVRNRIYNLLKEMMLRLETNPNYLTVPAAIRELEKIEMVRRNNGQYRLDHAVTKKQKVILSSFGLCDEDVRKTANEIGQLLTANAIGEWLFSFDKKKIYNMFRDYPHNMTMEEVEIFDKENPYWKDFFSDRK